MRHMRFLSFIAIVFALLWGGSPSIHAQFNGCSAGFCAVSPAGSVPMSIAFVAAADGGNTTGTSFTVSYIVGSGSHRLLVVGVIGDQTSDVISGATYAGSVMALAAKFAPVGFSNRWEYFFYILNPASGTNNIVVSASTSTFIAIGSADYTGVKQSSQPDASITNASSGGAPASTLTTAITTVADNSWSILLENSFTSSLPPSAGAGATLRVVDATFGSYGIFDSNGPVHPAGSYSMTTNRPAPVISIDHIVVSFSPG